MPKFFFGGGFCRIVLGEIFRFFWFFTSKTALFFIFLLVFGLILPVSFLIVSAGFLILSADAIRESADSLIVSARRKAGWVDLSLSCEDFVAFVGGRK